MIFLSTSPDVSNSYMCVGCIVIHKHGRCSCADRSDRSLQCSSLTGTTHGRHFFLSLLSFGEVMDRFNARSVRQIHCNVHHASLPSDTFKCVSSVLKSSTHLARLPSFILYLDQRLSRTSDVHLALEIDIIKAGQMEESSASNFRVGRGKRIEARAS